MIIDVPEGSTFPYLNITMNTLNKYLRFGIILALVLLCGNSRSEKVEDKESEYPSHDKWDELLKKHVKAEGLVDYKGFISDKNKLEDYITLLGNTTPQKKKWSREEQLSFWINAYNAFTVKLIVDNYPLKSIKNLNPVLSIPTVRSIWSKKIFVIGGEPISLDQIEHGILRKEFEEPRIHFAVNCASFSCPVLRAEAYLPEKINEQLEEQTVLFLNDSNRNIITADNPKISKIFSWFTKDFKKNGTVIDFLNQYVQDVKIERGADIDYLNYDWKLNEAK